MAILRHEINLINGISGNGSGASDSPEITLLDANKYSGTVTCYFEIVLYSSDPVTDQNITLRRKGTSTDDATIAVTHGTANGTLMRSSSFTPPAGQTEYVVHSPGQGAGGAASCPYVARLIIIQDTGSDSLTAVETQIEIGSNATTTSLTNVPISPIKYWKYNSANFNGTITAYFEVAMKTQSTKSAATATLQVADGTGDGFVNWADVGSASLTTSSATAARVRSAAITLTAGRNYRVVIKSLSTKETVSLYSAKIIIDQGNEAILSTGTFNIGTFNDVYGGSGTQEAIAQSLTTVSAYSLKTIVIKITKAGSPTDNIYMDIATSIGGAAIGTSDSIAGSSLVAGTDNNTCYFNFSTPVSLSSSTQYFFRLLRDGTRDSTNYYSWRRASSDINASESSYTKSSGSWDAGNANDRPIRLAASITLLENQYLLYNGALAIAGTGFQLYLTKWDSTEWSGVTNTYSGEAEAANGSTSVITIQEADGGSTVATISSPDNMGTGAATMPSSQNLDVKVTTNNNDVAAVRLLAAVVVSSAVNASVTQVAGTVTAAGGTQVVEAIVVASASVTQVAGTVTAAGGTQTMALNLPQSAATVTATGGTQVVAAVQIVSIAQVAGTVTAAGGTQTIATVNIVSITQVAGSVTATGGTQSVATVNIVAISQAAGAVTAAGGTQAIATVNIVNISQVAASVTAAGGTQTVSANVIVNASITQVAATITASGGTQAVASVQNSAITQVAGTVTAAGGTQTVATVNIVLITQLAASVTAAGGTQVVASVQIVSITQLAGSVTATGGDQVTAGDSSSTASVTQLAATITATGGDQVIVSFPNAAVDQLAASVTAAGGDQTVVAHQDVAIDQVAATVTASGGTQAVEAIVIVSATVDQAAGVVTATGGSQVVESSELSSITQVAASVTASGGVQDVLSVSGASVDQVAGVVTATGGVPVISTSTGPLPPPPDTVFLLDGHVAVKVDSDIFLPL